jgi:DNA-binding HxlR family transcriptional regulator
MAVSRDRTTKKLRLLYACKEPKRFTELIEEVDVSRAWLSEALRDLIKKGLIAKTPDDRYILTEKGRALIEEREVMELVREAVRALGAETVKRSVEELLKKRVAKAVSEVELADALIRLLRVWANVTAYWLACTPFALSKRVSGEEMRAVAAVESVLRELGKKERWWQAFRTLVPEADMMEDHHRIGVAPVIGMVENFARPERIVRFAEEELQGIKTKVDVMDTSLREPVLLLLSKIEERKRALEQLFAEETGKKRHFEGGDAFPSDVLAWFMRQSPP